MANGYQAPNVCEALSEWLGKTRDFSIEYNGFLSNHMAHYLVVLGCINLGEETVEAQMNWWWDLYIKKMEPLPSVTNSVQITNDNWFEFVNNDRTHYPELLGYFEAQVAQRGVRATVREHLPYLMDGLAGAALHPIIHLGLGLEAGPAGAGVAAQGLAYMCCRSLCLCIPADEAGPGPVPNSRGLLESTREFIEEARVGRLADLSSKAIQSPPYSTLATSSFQKKIRCFNDKKLPHGAALAALSEFSICGVASPAPEEDLLAPEPVPSAEAVAGLAEAVVEATAVAAAAYLASGCEFFVIHVVTSLHAVLVAMQVLPHAAQVQLLRFWWRAAMATLVSTGLQGVSKLADLLSTWQGSRAAAASSSSAAATVTDPDSVSERWWKDALCTAISSTDEHPAKAVYVLWRWSCFAGMPQRSKDLFKAAAAAQVRSNDKGGPEANMFFA